MSELKGKIVVDGEMEEKKEFSFTKNIDGVSKTVRGEQVENGWIITISKEWKEKNGDGIDYKYETKKYISKDNPMDKLRIKNKDKGKKEVDNMLDTFKDIMSSGGLLFVD